MTNHNGNKNGNNPRVVNADNTTGRNIIILFNPVSRLPLKLSGGHNFAIWKAQLSMLMYCNNLLSHLYGTTLSLSSTITLGTNTSPNPSFLTWFCLDKIIKNSLMTSVKPTIASIVTAVDSTKLAWDAVHTTNVNRSQTRVFSFPDQLAHVTKESHSIIDYLHTIRSISDELATAGAPLSNP
ncbi:uncharacterized protein LOC107030250 [Solanum pennellii]|uniref:Uncharacterized protein LOC107030250 n=1 Tax=Solanum pennellii TaxID=28526 RepID=A0ABM1HL46_SOLPN|nr:uncharacterized protein LOC107030250 [Solanum pennellii]